MPDIPSETDIQAIISSSSLYSPSNKPKLDAYLRAQATGNVPYSFNANRVLMKLYQFFPSTGSSDDKEKERANSALCLLLALLQYPLTTDIVALTCLIPERLKNQEPCASILQCAEKLDSCQFVEFWKLWKALEDDSPAAIATLSLANHHESLQAAICSVLALSYRTAPLKMVLAAMDMSSGSELTGRKDLSPSIIESADASNVYFTPTSNNTKRNRVYQDVDFTAISSLMAKVAKE